jgi:hypothetical protein
MVEIPEPEELNCGTTGQNKNGLLNLLLFYSLNSR